APPVPEHAQAEPAPLPSPHPRVLPATRPLLPREHRLRLLRAGAPPPPRGRRAAPSSGGRLNATREAGQRGDGGAPAPTPLPALIDDPPASWPARAIAAPQPADSTRVGRCAG